MKFSSLVVLMGLTIISTKALADESRATLASPIPFGLIDRELGAVQTKDPKDLERLLVESRMLYWKAKYTEDEDKKLEIYAKALELAEQSRALNPKHPQAILNWLAAKGELAQLKSKFVAITYIKPIEQLTLELKEIAPSYNHYAADRILARLYQKAPPIISIGSRSKALEHFQSALKGSPEFPGNIAFYSEFLLDDDQNDKAKEAAQKLLTSPALKEFPIERAEWERMANAVLAKVTKDAK